jgi:hypothetical protein
MLNINIFDPYLLALQQTAIDAKTEHTDRATVEALLRAFVGVATVQHEPKRVADKGAPDFKITKAGQILGYLETKTIGENLDRVLKSHQNARYKSLSQNIVTAARALGSPRRISACSYADLHSAFAPMSADL